MTVSVNSASGIMPKNIFRLIGAYIAAKQIEKILVIRPQKLDLAVLVAYPDDLIAVKLDMRCFVRRRDIVP